MVKLAEGRLWAFGVINTMIFAMWILLNTENPRPYLYNIVMYAVLQAWFISSLTSEKLEEKNEQEARSNKTGL